MYKKKETQYNLKCYKNIEREERKYCPCKQLVCGKLTVCISCVLLVGLKKIEPCFLCFSCWKILTSVYWRLEDWENGGHVLILRNHPSKRGRAFVGNALVGVWRRSKKKGSLWLAVFHPITEHLVSDSVYYFNNIDLPVRRRKLRTSITFYIH